MCRYSIHHQPQALHDAYLTDVGHRQLVAQCAGHTDRTQLPKLGWRRMAWHYLLLVSAAAL